MFNSEKKHNSSEAKRNPDILKIEEFLKTTSLELQKEGVPVLSDERIDMFAFQGVYPDHDIESDDHNVKMLHKKWYGDLSESELHEKHKESDGEKLEMLSTALLQKNMGDNFIVTRASEHDDIHNGIDNVLLDRRTGNVVCAFDEVGDVRGDRYAKKVNDVMDKNIHQSGVSLKYGLGIKHDNEEVVIERREVRNIPIFYLALDERLIAKGLKEILPSSKQSDFEKQLFKYFASGISINLATKVFISPVSLLTNTF